jgi:hypothetical protein
MTINILIIAWNRPQNLVNLLKIISSYGSDLNIYIAIDGETKINSRTDERVSVTKKVALDYRLNNTNTYIKINPVNLGCKNAVVSAIDWFFTQVDKGVILEDDLVFDPSLLDYFKIQLGRYENQKQIFSINGYNPIDAKYQTKMPYLTRFPHIWGWATWADRWSLYNAEFSKHLNHLVNLSSLETIKAKPFNLTYVENYYLNQFKATKNGLIDTWDYQWVWTIWKYGGLAIAPPVNLVKNIGFDADATHTLEGESAEIDANASVIIRDLSFSDSKLEYSNHIECCEEVQKFLEFGGESISYEKWKKEDTKFSWTAICKLLYRNIVPFPIRDRLQPLVVWLRGLSSRLVQLLKIP